MINSRQYWAVLSEDGTAYSVGTWKDGVYYPGSREDAEREATLLQDHEPSASAVLVIEKRPDVDDLVHLIYESRGRLTLHENGRLWSADEKHAYVSEGRFTPGRDAALRVRFKIIAESIVDHLRSPQEEGS